MQLSNLPAKIQTPFAVSGSKRTIPLTSQIGVTAGAASFPDGFPPLTFTPLNAGGIPPAGQDFNGILYAITLLQQWQSAGGGIPYDSAWATANSGYPVGAVVMRADGQGYWFNTVDNNTANPDGATPTGWVPEWQYGITPITGLTNVNVTLTSLQYGRTVISLAGALTGNVQIIFPVVPGEQWLVVNNTTGAFTVTLKTAAGTGVTVPSGRSAQVWCDGANIQNVGTPYTGPRLDVVPASGSYTVPAGVYSLDVEVWGGGGGGGGVGSAANGSAGGGGGGGYARGIIPVTPGQVITTTIGAAGAAGSAGGAGGAGGTTTFGVLSATGGSGGSANGGGTGGTGGTGSGGAINGIGANGSGGLQAGASGPGGPGGGTPYGGPGGGSAIGIAAGGSIPGGGGGGTGSSVAQTGALGARGQINIHY